MMISCPACGKGELQHADAAWMCPACQRRYPGTATYLDLQPAAQEQTASHYSLQWGEQIGFLQFIQEQRSKATSVMPSARLGWNALFEEIRAAASQREVWVYDAGCGFGGVANELFQNGDSGGLRYIGADLHGSLSVIPERIPALVDRGMLVRWNIEQTLPCAGGFDYVICRAAIHHTSTPADTFRALCGNVRPGGTIAISAYRKKSITREAMDEALRREISVLDAETAFETSRQFTVLGKALQQLTQQVEIPVDLPLFGIKAGSHHVQPLIYYHLLKCFYNETFGDTYSTLVNYDWYHPEHAFRYDIEELREWFDANGLELVEEQSIEVQHYLRGRRLA
jgi:SAM-dependent methyltransferase